MSRTYERIDDDLRSFIDEQHLFFVASAPSVGGHVNLSPKGLDTFRVIDDHTVGYLDLTGSGVETIAHLRENGRLTVLFCAFAGRPRIVRLQGSGRATMLGEDGYAGLAAPYGDHPGARAVIHLDVERISDSCGFAVPNYDYVGDRDVLTKWAVRKSPDELDEYRRAKNAHSIDGLPLRWPDPD